MSNLVRLYPPVKVTGQSFVGVKRCVVPNQSLTLRQIIQRFVRREALPVAHSARYEERFGDLEKMMKEDITEQMERVAELKQKLADFQKRQEERAAREKEEFEEKERAKTDAVLNTLREQLKADPEKGKTAQKSPPKGA